MMAATAYVRAEALARGKDAGQLGRLGKQLDTGTVTFPFAHARLAWLESRGGRENS